MGQVTVHESITRLAPDVSRPHRRVPPSTDLGHLPGEHGLLAGITNPRGWMERGVEHLVDMQRRYGDVHRAQFATWPMVYVHAPELVARIARNDDGAFSAALGWRQLFDGIEPGSAQMEGLVFRDFEAHRDARRRIQPAFTPAALSGYVELARPRIERRVEAWIAEGRVAMKPALRRLLAEVSTTMFAGCDDPREAAAIDAALLGFWSAPMALVRSRWLSRTWRRGIDGYASLLRLFGAKVAERRARGGQDLFSQLCTIEDAELDDPTRVRLYVNVLSAAFDTTSLGLASMMHLLAREPVWQERVRRELSAASPEDLFAPRGLELTERVWKETLRLFPVASSLPRQTLAEVTIGGHRLPPATVVYAVFGTALRDPRWWTEPDRFDPDRFTPERAEEKKNKAAYMPFGAGAHVCIGQHLATLEVRAFCHALLTRARLHLEGPRDPGHELRPLGSVKGDVPLRLEPL